MNDDEYIPCRQTITDVLFFTRLCGRGSMILKAVVPWVNLINESPQKSESGGIDGTISWDLLFIAIVVFKPHRYRDIGMLWLCCTSVVVWDKDDDDDDVGFISNWSKLTGVYSRKGWITGACSFETARKDSIIWILFHQRNKLLQLIWLTSCCVLNWFWTNWKMGQTLGRAPVPSGCKRFLNRKKFKPQLCWL